MKSPELIHLFLKIMLHVIAFCKTNFCRRPTSGCFFIVNLLNFQKINFRKINFCVDYLSWTTRFSANPKKFISVKFDLFSSRKNKHLIEENFVREKCWNFQKNSSIFLDEIFPDNVHINSPNGIFVEVDICSFFFICGLVRFDLSTFCRSGHLQFICKHQKNVWNLFKVSSKYTAITSFDDLVVSLLWTLNIFFDLI